MYVCVILVVNVTLNPINTQRKQPNSILLNLNYALRLLVTKILHGKRFIWNLFTEHNGGDFVVYINGNSMP